MHESNCNCLDCYGVKAMRQIEATSFLCFLCHKRKPLSIRYSVQWVHRRELVNREVCETCLPMARGKHGYQPSVNNGDNMPVFKPKAKRYPMFWYPPKGNAGVGAWIMGRITTAWNREEKLSAKGAKYETYSINVETLCSLGDGTYKKLECCLNATQLSFLEEVFPHKPAGRGMLPEFPEVKMPHYFGAIYLQVEGGYPQPEFAIEDSEDKLIHTFNVEFLERYAAIMGEQNPEPWSSCDSFHAGLPQQVREYCLKNNISLTGDDIPF